MVEVISIGLILKIDKVFHTQILAVTPRFCCVLMSYGLVLSKMIGFDVFIKSRVLLVYY